MGNIIVANMQATLTLDKSQFDAERREAQADLDALKQSWRDLPTAAGANVGKDAERINPAAAEERGHRRRTQLASEASAAETQHVQTATQAVVTHTQVVEAQQQRQQKAYAETHRERMGQLELQMGALDTLTSKAENIKVARLLTGVTDPEQVDRTMRRVAEAAQVTQASRGGWTGGEPVATPLPAPMATPVTHTTPTTPVAPVPAPVVPPATPPVVVPTPTLTPEQEAKARRDRNTRILEEMYGGSPTPRTSPGEAPATGAKWWQTDYVEPVAAPTQPVKVPTSPTSPVTPPSAITPAAVPPEDPAAKRVEAVTQSSSRAALPVTQPLPLPEPQLPVPAAEAGVSPPTQVSRTGATIVGDPGPPVVPPEVVNRMREIAGTPNDANVLADYISGQVQGGTMPVNVAQLAAQMYPSIKADYDRQVTPEAQMRQAIATEQALAKQARGVPVDPLEAAIERRERAEAKAAAAAAMPDDDDAGTGGGGRPPRHRSFQTQRYEFFDSPAMQVAQQVGGELGMGRVVQALPAFAGGLLGAVTAVGALTVGLVAATNKAVEFSRVEFQTERQVEGSVNAATLETARPIIEAQLSQAQYGRETREAVLATFARSGADQDTVERVLPGAVGYARQYGQDPATVVQAILGAGEGQGSGFFYENLKQYGVTGATPQGALIDVINQQTKGALDDYLQTTAGKAGSAGFTLEQFGQSLSDVVGSLFGTLTGAQDQDLGKSVSELVQAGSRQVVDLGAQRRLRTETGERGERGERADAGVTPAVPEPRRPMIGPPNPFTGDDAFGPPPEESTAKAVEAAASAGDLPIQTAAVRITAMRNVREMTEDTVTAVQGVQEVFGKLTTFHVDWDLVRPSLENLQNALLKLDEWWSDLGNVRMAFIKTGEANYLKAWLEILGQIANVEQQGADMLEKVYASTGLIPSDGELTVVVERVNRLFNIVEPIARAAMDSADPTLTGEAVAFTEAYAKSVTALVAMLSGGSDVLAKIFSLPVPDDATVERAAKAAAGMLGKFGAALVAEFYKPGNYVEKDAARVIDPILGQASALTEQGGKLMQAAASGLQMLQGFRNLHVPGEAEIDRAVDAIMDITWNMSARISERIADMDYSKGAPFAGTSGKDVLNQVGEASDDVLKLIQASAAGVAAISSMRNLSIPDDATLARVVGATFRMASLAAAEAADFDPAQLQRMTNYATALGPMMQATQSSVGALQGMRNLHIPSEGELDGVRRSMDTMFSWGRSMDPDAADRLANGANAMGAQAQAVEATVGALQGMRNLHLPSEGELDGVRRSMDAVFSWGRSMDPDAADRLANGANAAGAQAQAVQATVSALQGMRNLHVPDPEELERVHRSMDVMASWGGSMDPDAADRMVNYSTAVSAQVQAVQATVGALSEMRDLALPGPEQFEGVRRGMDTMFTWARSMDPDAADRVANGAHAMQTTFAAIGSAASAMGSVHEAVMPSEDEMEAFWGRFTAASEGAMTFVQRFSQPTADRAIDVGTAMQAQFAALTEGTEWLGRIHETLIPSARIVDEVFDLEMRIGDRMMERSQGMSRDYTKNAEDYGVALQAVFGAVAQGGQVIESMPRIQSIPVDMLDDFFNSIDNISERMVERAQQAQQSGSLVPEQVSGDLMAEFQAIASAAEAVNSIGIVRLDVSGPIDTFFDNLETMHAEFHRRFGDYKDVASKQTHDLAIGIQTEMDAINAAIEPLTNMDKASRVGPAMIDAVLKNARYMIQEFGTFATLPEMQGDARARLESLADVTGNVAGAINDMTQAVASASKPQSSMGTQNVLNMLDNVYRRFGSEAGGEGTYARPMHGGGSAEGTYTNCIIINGDVVAEGDEVASLIAKLSADAMRKQGGVPVQQARRV